MAVQGEKGQLFNNISQASSYADFRPTYPPHLFDTILEFAKLPALDLAVDLGCGKTLLEVRYRTKVRTYISYDENFEVLKMERILRTRRQSRTRILLY